MICEPEAGLFFPIISYLLPKELTPSFRWIIDTRDQRLSPTFMRWLQKTSSGLSFVRSRMRLFLLLSGCLHLAPPNPTSANWPWRATGHILMLSWVQTGAGTPWLLAFPLLFTECGAHHALVGEMFIKNASKTFHWFFGHCGGLLSPTSKNTSLWSCSLIKTRLLDFAGMKAIQLHPSRLSNLSRIFWTTCFMFIIRVMSMNAFIEGMCNSLPMCASGILDPAAFNRICIASTNREGETAPHSYPNLQRNPPLAGKPHHEPAKVFLKDVDNGLWHMMGLQHLPKEMVYHRPTCIH